MNTNASAVASGQIIALAVTPLPLVAEFSTVLARSDGLHAVVDTGAHRRLTEIVAELTSYVEIGPRRWPLRLVGAIRHRLRGPVIRQPLQRDGMPRAVPGEPGRERAIVLGDPYRRMHVEAGVRPSEHAGGLVLVEPL